MKATELIIGSTYLSVKWQKPVRLELSDMNELYHLCEGAELDSEIISRIFKPIELTKEWFKKAKFKKQKTFGIANYWQIKIKGDWIGFYEKEGIWYWDNTFTKTVKFVHNLQNFIYELTGQELTIA